MLLGRTGGMYMSMKQKKAKKSSSSPTPSLPPEQKPALSHSSQKPGTPTVGTSVGAIFGKVKSYLLSGESAEA